MATTIILRVQQQGWTRATGYQATQWAVTVPVLVPGDAAPIGTTPLSYAPLFVVDGAGSGIEILRRVATLRDFVELPEAECKYFEARGTGGNNLLSLALAGDTLRIPNGPAHWIQTQAPYTTHDFTVEAVPNRAEGTLPQVLAGRDLKLPGYTFGTDDVGRWVRLTGFGTSAYNGYVQILGTTGDVAHVDRTHATTETGGGWAFPHVRIKTDAVPTVEPRYFPTRESNLPWRLHRGNPDLTSPLASATSGGATRRGTTTSLVRSRRFTHLAATLAEATALFDYVAAALTALQAEAETSDTAFTVLLTRTAGP